MLEVFKNLDWSVLITPLISIIPAILCITIHETSHGYVAYRLGDNTAKLQGRLTLNPIKHIDPIGLIMMAVMGFGWAKPVPINMRNFKNPKKGMALSALAGPVSNILLAIVVLFIYGALYPRLFAGGSAAGIVLQVVYRTAYISTALAVFNIIPLPPLDGSKILFSFLSDENYYKLMRFERYGMIVIWVLVIFDVMSGPLSAAITAVFDVLFKVAEFSFRLFR